MGVSASSCPRWRQVLAGHFRPHHAFLVGQLLAHLTYLDKAIAKMSKEVERRVGQFKPALADLDTVPGID